MLSPAQPNPTQPKKQAQPAPSSPLSPRPSLLPSQPAHLPSGRPHSSQRFPLLRQKPSSPVRSLNPHMRVFSLSPGPRASAAPSLLCLADRPGPPVGSSGYLTQRPRGITAEIAGLPSGARTPRSRPAFFKTPATPVPSSHLRSAASNSSRHRILELGAEVAPAPPCTRRSTTPPPPQADAGAPPRDQDPRRALLPRPRSRCTRGFQRRSFVESPLRHRNSAPTPPILGFYARLTLHEGVMTTPCPFSPFFSRCACQNYSPWL